MPKLDARIFPALLAPFLLTASCDQPADTPGERVDAIEFRDRECIIVATGSQSFKGTGRGYGPVFPWDPDDDPFQDEAWVQATLDQFRIQTEEFLIADFQRDGGAEACEAACAERDLGWEGQGCVAEGSYTFEGLDYDEPGYEESPRFRVSVDAEVQMGCACS